VSTHVLDSADKGLIVMLWVIKLSVLVRPALSGIPGQNADNWSVLKIMTALLEGLVFKTNVLMLAVCLEFVEQMLSVQF
jgi:hypothetical protein